MLILYFFSYQVINFIRLHERDQLSKLGRSLIDSLQNHFVKKKLTVKMKINFRLSTTQQSITIFKWWTSRLTTARVKFVMSMDDHSLICYYFLTCLWLFIVPSINQETKTSFFLVSSLAKWYTRKSQNFWNSNKKKTIRHYYN